MCFPPHFHKPFFLLLIRSFIRLLDIFNLQHSVFRDQKGWRQTSQSDLCYFCRTVRLTLPASAKALKCSNDAINIFTAFHSASSPRIHGLFFQLCQYIIYCFLILGLFYISLVHLVFVCRVYCDTVVIYSPTIWKGQHEWEIWLTFCHFKEV